MRFVFSPPADTASGLLTLPWRVPLAEWHDERLVEIRQRGLSRHVVRFAAENGCVYALKELDERLARKEYRLLRRLHEVSVPAVEATGVVVDRADGLDAVLVTRFLDYSSSYRALFANPRGADLTGRLLDALVELLVRLHLGGFMWGDCSLSNTLFRLDAGAFAAYLVDAETAEMHPSLTDGQRRYDLELSRERVAGELFDLQAGELLPAVVDPVDVADETIRRYEALWGELNREEILHLSRRIRPAVCSTTSQATAVISNSPPGARCPMSSRAQGGWPRFTSRWCALSRPRCVTGWTRLRSSMRCSNTAGFCRRRLAGTSGPRRRWTIISSRFSRGSPTNSPPVIPRRRDGAPDQVFPR